jgi:type II secretory pathway component PulC
MHYSLSKFKQIIIVIGLMIVVMLSLFMINRDAIDHDTQEKALNLKTNTGTSKIKEIASNEAAHTRITPSTHLVISDSQKEESPNRVKGIERQAFSSELNFKLVGTIIESGKGSYAIIVDETTGESGNYRVGDTISGFKVLKLDRDSVVLEREGRAQVLVFKGSNNAQTFHDMAADVDNEVLIKGSEQTFIQFEPVVVEEGPPIDENIPVKDLPYFEPITNDTGPPSNPEQVYRDLPEFIPIESESGPPD